MNVPKLRFKEFDGEWEAKNIGGLLEDNIILNQSDGNHGELYPKKSEFQNSGIPYLSASNIKENTLEYSDLKYLSLDRAKKFKKGVANDGDVLLAHNATVGPSVLLKTKYPFVILSTTLTLYRLNKEKMDNLFFSNILRSDNVQFQLKRMMKQTTRNQVPILAQRKINIHYPCNTKEQKKIGEFFGIIDKKIQLQQQKIDLLQEQKKGFLQKMFPKAGETQPEMRFDGFTGDWEERKLNEFTTYGSSSYSLSQFLKDDFQGVYPVFDANNEIARINTYAQENDYISIIKDGAGIGRTELRPAKSSVIGTMGYINPNNSDINFIYALMKNINWSKYQNGSTIPHVYYRDYGNEYFNIPRYEEQQQIGLFFKKLDDTIGLHQRKLDICKEQKKGFMQQMFI